jgi:8-oxo-dGTP diphosphatase
MCLCLVTRTSDDRGPEVLLGRKKRGFGSGNLVGLGGHVETGETPAQAAVRELQEESSLIAVEQDLTAAGTLVFRFPARPHYDQEVAVFTTDTAAGTARECDEIAPDWYAVDDLPLDAMWDDARYWLPKVLDGQRVDAEIVFAGDCLTVAQVEFHPAPPVVQNASAERVQHAEGWESP